MNPLSLVIGLAFGLLLGGIVAAFLSSRAGGKLAASESLCGELERRLGEQQETLDELRELLGQTQTRAVRAETQLEEGQKSLESERKTLTDTQARLRESFSGLAADALQGNNQQFLALAKTTLENYLTAARADLDGRKQASDAVLTPLRQTLEQYQQHLRQIELSRESAYTGLQRSLDDLKLSSEGLKSETQRLARALSNPQTRGRYGEIALRRLVEFAGLNEYCDFTEQESRETGDGRLRPDLVVRLPGGRTLVIDAKVPLDAYLRAHEVEPGEQRHQFLAQHARAVRSHVQRLSSKEYWKHFGAGADFAVLFMPVESSFSAALEGDPALLEDAMKSQIILAAPTTLILLLRSVAYSWGQAKAAENSRLVWEAGKELYTRLITFLDHLEKVGKSLHSAADSYNRAVASVESRLLPQARRLSELGVADGATVLTEPAPLDLAIRSLPSPEPALPTR